MKEHFSRFHYIFKVSASNFFAYFLRVVEMGRFCEGIRSRRVQIFTNYLSFGTWGLRPLRGKSTQDTFTLYKITKLTSIVRNRQKFGLEQISISKNFVKNDPWSIYIVIGPLSIQFFWKIGTLIVSGESVY